MDPVDVQYDRIAAGEAQAPREYSAFKRMLARARSEIQKGDVQARLNAVNVSSAIGGHWGMGVLRQAVKDPALVVRKSVLRGVIDAGEPGVTLLRDMVLDEDEAICLPALERLQCLVDPGSTGRLRRLLSSKNPKVRAGAVTLLGHVAGLGLVIAIQRMGNDPDPMVVAAVGPAVDRIEGRLPRDQPKPWWVQPPKADDDWRPAETLPLPAELPQEPEELLALLGRLSVSDQPVALNALQQLSGSLVSHIVRRQVPGGEPDPAIGACIAARLLKNPSWVVTVRRLLGHRNPEVRVAALEALAIIGTPSVVIGVRDLLKDIQPRVRQASLIALSALIPRKELEGYVKGMDADVSDGVRRTLRIVLGEE